MSASPTLLLKSNLKQLRLPTMCAEFEKLAREASAANEGYEQYLLRLSELEVAARSANALRARIKQAAFPVPKDFDTYEFTSMPSLNKQKILELARGEWIDQHYNVCLIGTPGTGKTHLAIALGQAACRQGRRVRFFTAAALVNRLEEAQKQYQLERLLRRSQPVTCGGLRRKEARDTGDAPRPPGPAGSAAENRSRSDSRSAEVRRTVPV